MYPSAAYTFFANRWTSDTGDSGQLLTAYTATFGGGASATIALEDPRRGVVTNTAALALGTAPAANQKQIKYPDVVANLRGDWAWGSLQVMGALHESSGGYYTTSEASGHPSDTWGYALGVGGRLKIPTGVNDSFGFQFNWTKGASRYAALLQGGFGNVILYNSGGVALGWIADGVYGAAGSAVNLTTVWGLNMGFDHGWSPTLRTSLYGTIAHVDYDGAGSALMAAAACGTATCGNPDMGLWLVGSRTQWTPVKGLIMGVDVMYERVQTAFGGLFTAAAFNGRTAGYPISDQGVWEVTFRIQRNILP